DGGTAAVLRRLYDWTLGLAGHRHALRALALVAFAESSFFPVPPDLLILPMVLADRRRAWLIAGVATLASAAGGLAGYAIGYFLFETIGRPILDFYGAAEHFAAFQAGYNRWGAWIVAAAGFTPIPYKVFTIASGVTGLDLAVFMLASVLSRGARFFLVAGLLWRFGPAISGFIERNLPLLATLFFLLLFGGFVLLRYL
ncbi:MAG: YqaA family protein, partial [Dongiaceae bacterium]